MTNGVIQQAIEMADALDDERGGADRFEAARLLRSLAARLEECRKLRNGLIQSAAMRGVVPILPPAGRRSEGGGSDG